MRNFVLCVNYGDREYWPTFLIRAKTRNNALRRVGARRTEYCVFGTSIRRLTLTVKAKERLGIPISEDIENFILIEVSLIR